MRIPIPALLLGAALCAAPPQPILTPAQRLWLRQSREVRRKDVAEPARRREIASGWWPQPVHIPCTKHDAASITILEVTPDGTSRPAPEVQLVPTKDGLLLYNCKPATRYRCLADGRSMLAFETADETPRLLRVPGVPNFRDVGGRRTTDGHRVRLGMLYRSAGLNENATIVYAPDPEKLRQPAIAAEVAMRERFIASCNQRLTTPTPEVPFSLGRQWRLFVLPEKQPAWPGLEHLEDMPRVGPDDRSGIDCEEAPGGGLRIPAPGPGQPAILFQTFAAPADGWMRLECQGDWWWSLAVNGVVVFDLLRPANGRGFHCVELPVRKGKNLLAVRLRSGSAAWGWQCRAANGDATAARKARIAFEKGLIEQLTRHVASFTPGQNRLDAATRDYLVKRLGIRTDLDLRSTQECLGMKGSPLGDAVQWRHIPARAYSTVDSAAGRAAFAQCLRLLLDQRAYPVLFHCISGQDRTGTLAFLLNGLLGVPEEELVRDWEATVFWNPDPDFRHDRRLDTLVHSLDRFPGKSIQERIIQFTLSLGFTDDDLRRLRAILLEPATPERPGK